MNKIDENGIIDSDIYEKTGDELSNESKYTYIPVGSCIPAYSRCDLINTAFKFKWENVCYFDTDSIFVIYDEDAEKVWKTINQTDFLGGWGLEEIIDRCQFTAPKRYKTETEGEVVIKAGGINFASYIDKKAREKGIEATDYKVSFDEINIISSEWEVRRAFRCKGGTLIDLQNKKMDVQSKYKDIYEKNRPF